MITAGLVNSINKKSIIYKIFCKTQDIKKLLRKKNSNSTEIIVLRYPVYTKKDILKTFLKKMKKTQKR